MWKSLLIKMSEKTLYGFGFGIGMGLAFKIVSIKSSQKGPSED